MYSMIDAEYFVSCFFFIVTIVVLNFWLLNLFVAVITNTFSAIREETHKSAFGAAPYVPSPPPSLSPSSKAAADFCPPTLPQSVRAHGKQDLCTWS